MHENDWTYQINEEVITPIGRARLIAVYENYPSMVEQTKGNWFYFAKADILPVKNVL